MKKLVLLLIVVLVGTTMVMGQNRGEQRQLSPEEAAKRQTEELKKDLKLDRVQVDKVQTYLTASNKELQTLREELSTEEDRFVIREKMTEFRNSQQEGLKKILKPEQVVKYDKMLEERVSRRRGGGSGTKQ